MAFLICFELLPNGRSAELFLRIKLRTRNVTVWSDLMPGGRATEIIEKPEVPPSNFAVTGLYFLDGKAPAYAKLIEPSARGELEITSLLFMYLEEGALLVERMGRGFAWLDTGTHTSLLDASNFVRTLTERQGQQVGCIEEIAYNRGWIDRSQLRERAGIFAKNDYGRYLNLIADGS